MTPKAEKLLETFNTKLNTKLYLFEQGINTFEESKKGLEEEYRNFDKFLFLSLTYGTITPNEFIVLSSVESFQTYFRKLEILIERYHTNN